MTVMAAEAVMRQLEQQCGCKGTRASGPRVVQVEVFIQSTMQKPYYMETRLKKVEMACDKCDEPWVMMTVIKAEEE